MKTKEVISTTIEVAKRNAKTYGINLSDDALANLISEILQNKYITTNDIVEYINSGFKMVAFIEGHFNKRGPGRPKKVVDFTSDIVPKRGPGRPRKIKTLEVQETSPKRRPGRPRKNPIVSSEDSPKRRPGRPKKNPIPVVNGN